jgi:hypothetical protein
MLTQDKVGASQPRGGEKTRPTARLWLPAVLFMFISPSVFALTGGELLEECSAAADSVDRKQCESYIDGVVSGINTLITGMRILHPGNSSYPQLFCVPRFAATKDLVAATVSYLKQHTESQHYDASSEILLALQQAYPCKGG